MKKLPIAGIVLLAVVALAVPAQAQTCLDWVSYCDGLQIDSATDQKIVAQWWNYDCAGTNASMKGKSKANSYASPCGGNDDVLIRCTVADGCVVVNLAGPEFYFVADLPLDGTLDMGFGTYNTGSCWVDELAYTVGLGACGGTAPQGQRSQKQDRSSAQ